MAFPGSPDAFADLISQGVIEHHPHLGNLLRVRI
jgi:hypothetical protein